MFAVKTIQFLLFFAILFQALAEPAYQSRSGKSDVFVIVELWNLQQTFWLLTIMPSTS